MQRRCRRPRAGSVRLRRSAGCGASVRVGRGADSDAQREASGGRETGRPADSERARAGWQWSGARVRVDGAAAPVRVGRAVPRLAGRGGAAGGAAGGRQALLTNVFTREGWAKDDAHGPASFMIKHDRRKD